MDDPIAIAREIERWAREHDLPYFDDRVHFPDFRIEYELHGRDRHEDVEVVTEHYRGAHAASVARAGFRCYGRSGGVVGVADVASIREWPKNSYDEARSRRACATASAPPGSASSCGSGSPSVRPGFSVHVLVFSGVFLERQYRAFTGLAHGQKTHDFLAKLVSAGYATPITPGALHRGRLYHVQYKPLYEAIGEPNNRHRKAASLGRFVERLMLLDAVLADHRYGWLGTEQDKRTYFREALETGPAGRLVSASHLRHRRGENDAILSRQAAGWRAAQRRAAARVSLPGHPRGAHRLSGVSPAARGPAQVGRRMDHSRPPAAAIPQGRGALSVCRSGRLPDDLQERRICTRRRHYQCASWSRITRSHSDLELAEIRETIGPKIADKAFEFWNNPDDALYDNL